MMEDTWLSIEDDSNSSFADSDAIDSETEADLYSIIHYEQNLHNLKCPTVKIENVHTSDETKYKSGSSDKCNVSCSQNSEGVHQTGKHTLSNKKKRKSDCDTSVSSSSVKKRFTVLNDSSDSDSIIWTEVDASDGKEFKTNLFEDDVIYVSSGSESQFDDLPLSKKSEGKLRNMSMPNIKIGENTKDLLWFVNEKDLRRSKQSRSRRYHDVENTCSNCHGKGHNYKSCPLPKTIKCFICGGVGHSGAMCAKRICRRCFNAGHDSKRCWRPYSRNCILCSMDGHVKENCPDLWRRYHLTTSPGAIVRGQKPMFLPGSLPYCCNCGQIGHLGSVCRVSRGPKYRLRTWPCVISYADPENLLKERLNKERPNNSRRENHLNQVKKTGGASILVFNSQENMNGERCNNSRRENHFNQMNTAVSANLSSEKKKKKKNNLKQQRKRQLKQLKKVQREKDFPRTPKINQSNCLDDSVPESLKKMLIKKQQRKKKNLRRKLKKRLLLSAERNGVSTDTIKSENLRKPVKVVVSPLSAGFKDVKAIKAELS